MSGKEYYQNNKERLKKRHEKYRQENKDKLSKYFKKYCEKHKEEKREYDKKYRQENKDRRLKTDSIYRENNREKIRLYQKEYNRKNKGKKKKRQEEYYKKNKNRILKRNKERYRQNKSEIKKAQIKYLKSPAGKISAIRHTNKRQRDLGFEILFDKPKEWRCPVEYHHISDAFVVAIPKFIHKQYLGTNHREKMKPIVEMLYGVSYIIEKGGDIDEI